AAAVSVMAPTISSEGMVNSSLGWLTAVRWRRTPVCWPSDCLPPPGFPTVAPAYQVTAYTFTVYTSNLRKAAVVKPLGAQPFVRMNPRLDERFAPSTDCEVRERGVERLIKRRAAARTEDFAQLRAGFAPKRHGIAEYRAAGFTEHDIAAAAIVARG